MHDAQGRVVRVDRGILTISCADLPEADLFDLWPGEDSSSEIVQIGVTPLAGAVIWKALQLVIFRSSPRNMVRSLDILSAIALLEEDCSATKLILELAEDGDRVLERLRDPKFLATLPFEEALTLKQGADGESRAQEVKDKSGEDVVSPDPASHDKELTISVEAVDSLLLAADATRDVIATEDLLLGICLNVGTPLGRALWSLGLKPEYLREAIRRMYEEDVGPLPQKLFRDSAPLSKDD